MHRRLPIRRQVFLAPAAREALLRGRFRGWRY
jgi:hypothetical protein